MDQLPPRQEIWRGLLYGQRSMMLRLAVTLKREYGLTVPQFEALLALAEQGTPVPMTQLAASLLYSSGSATHLVSRLAERGLVTRAPGDEDARVVMIGLTEAGKRTLHAAVEQHSAEIDDQFGPLVSDAEVEVLLAFARRWARREGVRTQPPAGPPGHA